MKTYKAFLAAGFVTLGLGLASCNDFLDVAPVDQLDDAEYWQTEEQVRLFANGFYPSYFTG